jgi:hypothetical protein
LNRRLNGLLAAAALVIVSPGCGESQLPDSAGKTSRSMLENPGGFAKGAEGAPAPAPKVSARKPKDLEKGLENARNADPRGK